MKTTQCVNKSRSIIGFNSLKIAVLALSLAGVQGCAVGGNTLPKLASNNSVITNSVVAQTKPEGVAATDADIIKSVVTTAAVPESINALAWQNPETGSSGTITAIDNFMGKHGQKCRGFKTSVDTFMGISFYNGEACQISPGQWVLSWFKPSE